MNTVCLYDFAPCPCGHWNAVQPSTHSIPRMSQQASETESETIFVACNRCDRVYNFDTDRLVAHQTTTGFGPHSPDAPMTVLLVPVPCDELNCNSHVTVIAMLNTNTTDAEMKRKKARWRWVGGELTCVSEGEPPHLF